MVELVTMQHVKNKFSGFFIAFGPNSVGRTLLKGPEIHRGANKLFSSGHSFYKLRNFKDSETLSSVLNIKIC